jgi:hypothetical protein
MTEALRARPLQLTSGTQVLNESALTPAFPSAMFERVIADRLDDVTMRWLVGGFRKYDEHEGKLPLERCLRLPTAAQRRLSERNFWLRSIGDLVGESRPVARAHGVARCLSTFMLRGPWREWKAVSMPPSDTGDLQRALFYAARAIGLRPIPKWRQIARILDRCHENLVC